MSSAARSREDARSPGRGKRIISYAVLTILLVLSFIPLIMMLSMSLRDSLSIYSNFWGLPWPPKWINYSAALGDLIMPIVDTIYLCLISIAGIILFATMSGYAFARLKFVGKRLVFFLIIMMMTVPGILLLTPNFVLADWLHLRNSLEGLGVFYIGGGQLFAIFLLRTFFQSLPEEMFEAARIEGASEFRCVWRIAVPLAIPILMTIAIMNFLSIYNDLIFPMLMVSNAKLQTISMALANYAPRFDQAAMNTSRPDLGIMTSGYVFASIPLLVLFSLGMKYFIEGLTSGSIKA